MADEIEGTFDKLKAGAKAVAKKVTDPGKDLGDEYEKEKGKQKDYQQTDESGSKDPMSPEKIASHALYFLQPGLPICLVIFYTVLT